MNRILPEEDILIEIEDISEEVSVDVNDIQPIEIIIPSEGSNGKSIRPVGEWSSNKNYYFLDLISYLGSSYVAKKAVPAGIIPTNSEYWQLSAYRGTEFILGDDLEITNGVLNIIKASSAEQDNTHPITAAAVYTVIGNINAILETI